MKVSNALSSLNRQKGLASVELALTTPFLLVLMFVSAEFTRVFYDHNTLTKGVRDAARFMAEDAFTAANTFEMTEADIAAAKNIVVFGTLNGGGAPLLDGLNIDQVQVTQVNLGNPPFEQEHIEVTVDYPYSGMRAFIDAMGFLSQDISLDFTLTATSTMRGL